jgi:hypothetical protein
LFSEVNSLSAFAPLRLCVLALNPNGMVKDESGFRVANLLPRRRFPSLSASPFSRPATFLALGRPKSKNQKQEQPMKIILQFIHWQFGSRSHPESKCPDNAGPETPGKPPGQTFRPFERSSFADDDSPPGHKIRWHL